MYKQEKREGKMYNKWGLAFGFLFDQVVRRGGFGCLRRWAGLELGLGFGAGGFGVHFLIDVANGMSFLYVGFKVEIIHGLWDLILKVSVTYFLYYIIFSILVYDSKCSHNCVIFLNSIFISENNPSNDYDCSLFSFFDYLISNFSCKILFTFKQV